MFIKKRRIYTFFSLLIVVPLGFGLKFYAGPLHSWVNNSLAGAFYEIFWCLVFLLLLPAAKPIKIALWVLIITCILETLQLWHPKFLEILRENFIGRTVLGVQFNPSDYIYYLLGSILGWFLMTWICKTTKQKN